MPKCKICGKSFVKKSNNQVYCSPECRKRAYINYKYYTSETLENYREKVKEEEGLDDSGFNYKFREKTAENKGMTVPEYNAYLEQRKADSLGVTLKELRHYTYIAKRDKCTLYEALCMTKDDYYRRLKEGRDGK